MTNTAFSFVVVGSSPYKRWRSRFFSTHRQPSDHNIRAMPLMVYPSRLVSRWRDGAARPSDDNISSALQFKVHLGTSFVVAPAQSAGYRTVRERPSCRGQRG